MSDPASSQASHLAELILQLGRAAYGEPGAGELTQAQWMALRFFARANRFSRTASAFADFHATTRGTASQTIKSLVTRGYLTRSPSSRDKRSSRFDLTALARETLAHDPLAGLVRAAAALEPGESRRVVESLESLMRSVAAERGRAAFGVCALCGHLDRRQGGGYRCRLMNEELEVTELRELCVRFARPA